MGECFPHNILSYWPACLWPQPIIMSTHPFPISAIKIKIIPRTCVSARAHVCAPHPTQTVKYYYSLGWYVHYFCGHVRPTTW